MDFYIGPATTESIPHIVRLMRDFAEYEKLADYCLITEDRLAAVMCGPDAFVKGLIADDGDQVVAYALFYKSFSSFRGQSGYFLEDLYVDDAYRGHGLGLEMLREVIKTAKADGAERLDFLVLRWNERAIGFYESLGAVHGEDEIHFKFADDAFDRLAV